MIVENQEDGTITSLDTNVIGKWLDVDTAIGVIDDGEEEMDGDWTWQAYTTSQEEDSLKS